MMTTLTLPTTAGTTEHYTPSTPAGFPYKAEGPLPRVAFAAAHVVSDPLAECDPWVDEAIDWDATIAYRRQLWSRGLGVAEAMDTAQRGMGLGWETAQDSSSARSQRHRSGMARH